MTRCILCLREDGGSAGQEHMLQDFLGARIVLEEGVVCDSCNRETSRLDGDLRRYLDLVFFNNAPLQGAAALAEIDGEWWATRVKAPSWERYLPPQCVLRPSGRVDAFARSRSDLDAMKRELGDTPEIVRAPNDNLL